MSLFHETSGPNVMGSEDPLEFDAAAQTLRSESDRKDVHHDPWLTTSSPELQAIAYRIFEKVENCRQIASTQRGDAKQRRRDMIDNIVANIALVVVYHPEANGVAISAKNAALTRYDRRGFSREVFVQQIKAMEALGYVTVISGKRGGLRTTIEPSRRLRSTIVGIGCFPLVGRLPGAETIILKASIGRGRYRTKLKFDYEDTAETCAMRAEMAVINNMLAKADLAFDGRPLPPQHLTRRFQIENPEAPPRFSRLGRLYDGLWETLPRTERHRLRINGEELADLDWTGMYVQLAYLKAGLPLPEGDPYDCGYGLKRAAAKIAILALFNKTEPMRRLSSELRGQVGSEWTAEQVFEAVARRHPGIVNLMGSGVGMSLMFTESQVMVRALLLLAARGISALPLHDGLFVAASSADTAMACMNEASREVLGVVLPIKRKPIREKAR